MTPQQADLALSKTVNDPTPSVGETITYTILLSNNGPDAATNVQVTDHLPAGLSFVSATPSQGTYDPGAGLWNVGTVAVGSPAMLLIRATVVSPGPQTNAATITHVDQFDPLPTNNVDGLVVLATPALPPFPPPTVSLLQRFGFHEQPTQFVLTFSSALDPARLRTFGITPWPRSARKAISARDPARFGSLRPATLTVTIHPATASICSGSYKLVVNGTPPTAWPALPERCSMARVTASRGATTSRSSAPRSWRGRTRDSLQKPHT